MTAKEQAEINARHATNPIWKWFNRTSNAYWGFVGRVATYFLKAMDRVRNRNPIIGIASITFVLIAGFIIVPPLYLVIGPLVQVGILTVAVVWALLVAPFARHRTSGAPLAESTADCVETDAKTSQKPTLAPAKTLIAEGIEKAKSGDFAGAILIFDKAISLDPTDPGVYFERSKAKKEVGDEAGAKHDVTEFKLRFERLEAGLKAHDLARAAYEVDDYKETIKQFNKAISLCPALTSIFYERGLAKQCLKDYRGAEEDFTRGIQANDSTKARAFHQRGKVKQKLKDPTGALQDFNDAIALCPDDPDMLFSRATIAEPYDGLRDLDRAIDLRPNEPMFYFVRAIRRHAMEDIEGAIKDLTAFVELKPMDESVSISEALSLRATMKGATFDHAGALDDYNMAIEADSGKATLYFERGLMRYRLRDYSGAVDDFGKSIALDNTYGEAHHWRGLSKSEMGLKDEAEVDFDRAKVLGYTEESE